MIPFKIFRPVLAIITTVLALLVGAALLLAQSTQFPNCVQVRAPSMTTLGGRVCAGTGTPESAFVGWIGDLFLRRDGGTGTTVYIKETGSGTTTGWIAITAGGGGGGLTSPVGETDGGTGQTSYTTGDLLYSSATDTLSKLAAGTSGYMLRQGASVPAWFNLFGTANTFSSQQTLTSGAKILTCQITAGTGSPESAVTGSVCDVFLRTDGGASTVLYAKESGTASNTGWIAYGAGGGGGGAATSIGTCQLSTNTYNPNGNLTGGLCDMFLRTNGGVGDTLYVKETSTSNFGWQPVGGNFLSKDVANIFTQQMVGEIGSISSFGLGLRYSSSFPNLSTAVDGNAQPFFMYNAKTRGSFSVTQEFAVSSHPAGKVEFENTGTNAAQFQYSYSAAGTATNPITWVPGFASVAGVTNSENGFKVGSQATGCAILSGSGSPETVVTGKVCDLFLRTDGGANTTMYVKESGAGNTGWIAK